MQGSVRKRCQCPVRYDTRGRLLACTKLHGSWSFIVDVPATDGTARRAGRAQRLRDQEGRPERPRRPAR